MDTAHNGRLSVRLLIAATVCVVASTAAVEKQPSAEKWPFVRYPAPPPMPRRFQQCGQLERHQKAAGMELDMNGLINTLDCAKRPNSGPYGAFADINTLSAQSWWWNDTTHEQESDGDAQARLYLSFAWWTVPMFIFALFLLIFPPAFIIGRYVFNCCGGRLPTHSACCPDGDERAVFSGYSTRSVICHKVLLVLVAASAVFSTVDFSLSNAGIQRRTAKATYAPLPPLSSTPIYDLMIEEDAFSLMLWGNVTSTPKMFQAKQDIPLFTEDEKSLVVTASKLSKSATQFVYDENERYRDEEESRFILTTIGVSICALTIVAFTIAGVFNGGAALPFGVCILCWAMVFLAATFGYSFYTSTIPTTMCGAFQESVAPIIVGSAHAASGCNTSAVWMDRQLQRDTGAGVSWTPAAPPLANFTLQQVAINAEARCVESLRLPGGPICIAVNILCRATGNATSPLFVGCDPSLVAVCADPDRKGPLECSSLNTTLTTSTLVTTNATFEEVVFGDLPLEVLVAAVASAHSAVDPQSIVGHATFLAHYMWVPMVVQVMWALAAADYDCRAVHELTHEVIYYRVCDSTLHDAYSELEGEMMALFIGCMLALPLMVKGIKRFRSPLCYPFPLAPMEEGYAEAHATETIDEAQIKRQESREDAHEEQTTDGTPNYATAPGPSFSSASADPTHTHMTRSEEQDDRAALVEVPEQGASPAPAAPVALPPPHPAPPSASPSASPRESAPLMRRGLDDDTESIYPLAIVENPAPPAAATAAAPSYIQEMIDRGTRAVTVPGGNPHAAHHAGVHYDPGMGMGLGHGIDRQPLMPASISDFSPRNAFMASAPPSVAFDANVMGAPPAAASSADSDNLVKKPQRPAGEAYVVAVTDPASTMEGTPPQSQSQPQSQPPSRTGSSNRPTVSMYWDCDGVSLPPEADIARVTAAVKQLLVENAVVLSPADVFLEAFVAEARQQEALATAGVKTVACPSSNSGAKASIRTSLSEELARGCPPSRVFALISNSESLASEVKAIVRSHRARLVVLYTTTPGDSNAGALHALAEPVGEGCDLFSIDGAFAAAPPPEVAEKPTTNAYLARCEGRAE